MSKAEELAFQEIRARCDEAQARLYEAMASGTPQDQDRARAEFDASRQEEAEMFARIGEPAPDVDFRPLPGDADRPLAVTVASFDLFPDDVKARFSAQFRTKDEAEDAIRGMEGPITYWRGPAPQGLDLVSTHPQDARSRWHGERSEFERLGTMDAPHDVRQAALAAGAGPTVTRDLHQEAIAGSSHTDLNERVALPPDFSVSSGMFRARDTATYLRVMRDAHVEYFGSTVAPQESRLDRRSGVERMAGGAKQYYVLAYDASGAVTYQEGLGRMTKLGATAADDETWHHTPGDHRLDERSDVRRRIDDALERMQRAHQESDDEGWDRAKADFDHWLDVEKRGFSQDRGGPSQHP